MGAGCSSPLRKLGKRSKRKCSEPYGADNLLQTNAPSAAAEHSAQESSTHSTQNDKSPSFCTQQDKQNEDTKISEQSLSPAPQNSAKYGSGMVSTFGYGRNLLYSPTALSPAPSTCYSPSPATTPDLTDLSESLRAMLFATSETNKSELLNSFSDYITVIFVTSDHLQPAGISKHVFAQVEPHLRNLCADHDFELKWIDLTRSHLVETFANNNLIDLISTLMSLEYERNSQRFMLLLLSEEDPSIEAMMPSNIDEKNFEMLDKCFKQKELLEKWYAKDSSDGTHGYRLKPLHTVLPNVVDASPEARFNAIAQWYKDSGSLIHDILDSSAIESQACLESIIETLTKFILDRPILQKRTYFIKSSIKHQAKVNQQLTNAAGINRGIEAITNLTRVLSDPNKLIIKKSLSPEEYFATVCDWIQDNLSKSVESILEDMTSKTRPLPYFERTVYIELTQQRQRYNDTLGTSITHFEDYSKRIFDELILHPIIQPEQKSSESNNESCGPLFICGPPGCGKSTIMALLIKRCNQEFVANAHIVYRFCGDTIDSLTEERMLRSVCEQFCQVHGEHISAASRIYSNRKETLNVLSRILRSAHISVVLLDGIDQLDRLSPAKLDWLTELEFSPRHQIVISLTKNSRLYNDMLNIYPPSCFYDLDEPTLKYCQSVVELAFTKAFHERYHGHQKTPPPIDNDLSMSYFGSNAQHYSYTYAYNVGHFLLMDWSQQGTMSKLDVDNCNKNENERAALILAILSRLETIVSPRLISYLLVALDSSRYGLSEHDIIHLIASNDDTRKTFYSTNREGSNDKHIFPAALWSYLRYQLEPWLVYFICDKNIKISFRQDFSKIAIELYAKRKFSNIVDEVRQFSLEYFSRPLKDLRKLSSTNLEPKTLSSNKLDQTGELRENLSKLIRMQLANQYSESTYIALLTDPTKAKDQLLNRYQFYGKFFYSCKPEEFIEDYERFTPTISSTKSGSGNLNELSHLVNYIRGAIYPLRYDGSQIFSQVYCRAYEAIKSGKYSRNRKIQDILNLACSPPVTSLLPISESSVNSMKKSQFSPMIATSTASIQQQQQQAHKNSNSTHLVNLNNSRQRLFTIEGNHRHMISISPERGTLVVWDIYEEKAVRVMNNLDQPRDLRMIDQKRAVILCNRELKVYDLDSGELLTKLKGVMNQKMPFFDIHGDQYVVALARNRMYVNMLNLVTGELETTFKVGEDRFLNSLLVSANGSICVCGDETQKPFPLLVWDLNERRLLYDLRLDRHEFLTRISAISDDGHYVASACRQLSGPNEQPGNGNNGISSNVKASDPQQVGPTPNFVVVYDLNSGTMFKKWKPGLDSCSILISLSANKSGKVINGVVNSNIIVWDLATGAKRHTLVGHTAPVDTLHVQSDRLFSMDSSCRDKSLRTWDIEKGTCLAVFTPDSPVNCCRISIKGDALVCGFSSDTRLSTLALCKNELLSDIVKRNRRRKSSGPAYIFDEPAPNRKTSQQSS